MARTEIEGSYLLPSFESRAGRRRHVPRDGLGTPEQLAADPGSIMAQHHIHAVVVGGVDLRAREVTGRS